MACGISLRQCRNDLLNSSQLSRKPFVEINDMYIYDVTFKAYKEYIWAVFSFAIDSRTDRLTRQHRQSKHAQCFQCKLPQLFGWQKYFHYLGMTG